MALLGSNQAGNRFSGGQNINNRNLNPVYANAAVQNMVKGSSSSETAEAGRSQKDSVLFGNELKQAAPEIYENDPVLYFRGCDNQGKSINIPISDSVLSRHIMLLGGIGTGKTNAFFQMVSQITEHLTDNDVMIIFDTKGDFYNEFYSPGDVVISNDETSVGPDGKPDYWNIFNEVSEGTLQSDGVMEISKSLFKKACEKTNQVFFPNAARDIFMSTMLHFLRYSCY
ncbi:MAG: type IV secretion system DNA-binding domain-containing protein [Eubacteriales bacterium]|nr:type IV secretion system DNA-binding domain-containing protein [Eubacteriales bacterium]